MVCCGYREFSLSSCSRRFYFSWSWVVDGCLWLHYAMHNVIPCKSFCTTFEVCCQGETVNGHGLIHHNGKKEKEKKSSWNQCKELGYYSITADVTKKR